MPITRERVQRALEGFYAYLEKPLYFWTRPLLFLLVLPLAFGLTKPLWHIQMEAPQYPDGLTVDIYAHKLEGGNEGNDLREINILNHYIGMKKIERADLKDLDWLPFGFGILAILLLRVAVVGNVRSLLDLAVMASYFALFSMGRFGYKLYSYGHDLSPDAPVTMEPFTPAILGTKQVGNFTTHSFPGVGTYLVTAFVAGVCLVAFLHLVQGRREAKRKAAQASAEASATVAA
jgi:copper chaperone NosL